MPEITSALMTIRKRNVRILLCVQSISSLYKLYGKYEAKEIIDCCVQKIILKINVRENQEIISRTIGEDYRFVRSERRHKGTNERTLSPLLRHSSTCRNHSARLLFSLMICMPFDMIHPV